MSNEDLRERKIDYLELRICKYITNKLIAMKAIDSKKVAYKIDNEKTILFISSLNINTETSRIRNSLSSDKLKIEYTEDKGQMIISLSCTDFCKIIELYKVHNPEEFENMIKAINHVKMLIDDDEFNNIKNIMNNIFKSE